MNRRRFLTACGLGFGTLGGCLGLRGTRTPNVPEGMDVATLYREADVLAGGSDRGSEFLEWQAEYHTVIADGATADRRIVDDPPVGSFVAETDFEESVLIVVQNGMQSEMELVLAAVERQADGLHLDVSIDSPQGGPDDLRIHSLLVRVTDPEKRVPEKVSVSIEGYV